MKILHPTKDNGRTKETAFETESGEVIVHQYNYGNGYGFKFITKYNSIHNYEHRLSVAGGEMIYSSTLEADCTEEGRIIELQLSKMKF